MKFWGKSKVYVFQAQRDKYLKDPSVQESDKQLLRQAKFGKNYIKAVKNRHGFRHLKN